MPQLKHFKVLDTLPSVRAPDAVYYVAEGPDSCAAYVTNAAGVPRRVLNADVAGLAALTAALQAETSARTAADQSISDLINNLPPSGLVKLTGDLDLYVATTGNDGNNGLSPTTPFRTPQRAWSYICQTYVLVGAFVRVNIDDGYYPDGFSSYAAPSLGNYQFYENTISPVGSGTIQFKGNASNRGAVQIDGQTELTDWSSLELIIPPTVQIYVDDVQINSFASIIGGPMYIGNIRIKGAYTQMQAGLNGYIYSRYGKTIQIDGNGETNTNGYLASIFGGHLMLYGNVDIVNPINCPNGLFRCYQFGKIQIYSGMTFSGANLGKKFLCNPGGFINTSGRTIPGSAGIVDAGGTVV